MQRSEIARLTREKDVLHDRLREAENKLEGEKKAAGVYRRDVAAKLQAADHALKVRYLHPLLRPRSLADGSLHTHLYL